MRIGVGGMAEVYLAQGTLPGDPKELVVKRLLPSVAELDGAVEMFEEEARIGALVRHPSVVRVLRSGTEGSHPWLALEYIAGVDLRRFSTWLTRTGQSLGIELVVFLVRELLAGLEAVHSAKDESGRSLNIVHRDVSPSNTLLSIDGRVLLGDFGIAHARMAGSFPAAHKHGRGKLGYISPEQLRRRRTDQRADVFAAAVIAAELLMGRPLFTGGSELAILLAIRDAEVHPFREHVSNLPAGLGAIILRALERDPNDRTADAYTFRDALAGFQSTTSAVLRAELGQLVAAARLGRGQDPEQLDTRELALSDESTTPLALEAEEIERMQATPALTYAFETLGGDQLGPWTQARAIEAVATGRIAGDDRVAVGGAPPKPVRDVAELRIRLPASTALTGQTNELGAAPVADRNVSLADGGIIAALARSAIERETGLWLCELSGIRKEIYLLLGAPQFVTSNLHGELLGEYLVRNKIITRSELDKALAVMPRFEARLGDTLTTLGLVDPMGLLRHIGDQVTDKLLDLFTWNKGGATFYSGVAAPESGFPLDLDAWSILALGMDKRFSEGLEQAAFESRLLDRLVVSTTEKLTPPQRAAVPREIERALAVLEHEPLALAELVERFDDESDPRVGYRAARLLLSLELVRWEE